MNQPWTSTVRRELETELPYEKALPDHQPAFVRSWVYLFGVATLASLVAIIVSGIVLAIFGPDWWHRTTTGAVVNSVHFFSVQLMFFFLALHFIAQLVMATWRRGRGMTWVVGAFSFFAAIVAAFTGYVSQTNFEAQWVAVSAKDGFNAIGVGSLFNTLDTGQMLALHIAVFPAALSILVAWHMIQVRRKGVCPPIEEGEEMSP